MKDFAINKKYDVDPDFTFFYKKNRQISRATFLREIHKLTKDVPKMPNNFRAFRIIPDTELGQIIIMLLSKYDETHYCRIAKYNVNHHIIEPSILYDSNKGNTEISDVCIYCNGLDCKCLYCNGIDPNSENKMLYCLSDVFIRQIPSSEFIPRKDIYSYYSERCENIYFKYESLMVIAKYIFDTPEKKWNRRKNLFLLYKRHSEHKVLGNFDIIRIILYFL